MSIIHANDGAAIKNTAIGGLTGNNDIFPGHILYRGPCTSKSSLCRKLSSCFFACGDGICMA